MQNCAVKMAVAPCLNIKYESKRHVSVLLRGVVAMVGRQVAPGAPMGRSGGEELWVC